MRRKILIIDKKGNELNPIHLFNNLNNKEDFNFCVTKERLEEIIVFSRNDYKILDIEEAKDFNFFKDDIVICRTSLEYLKDNISFSKTKFNDPKKLKNIIYWYRFVKPIYRKMTEVKFEEIRRISFQNNKEDEELSELINNPVFIKYIHKRVSTKISNFVGDNIFNAMNYSYELVNNDEDMLLSKKVRMDYEFRCFIVDEKIANISPYIDYQNKMIFNKSDFLFIKKRIKKFVKSLNIPFKKFPEMFVIDIFMNDIFLGGKIDIVEFNPYNTSGRYLFNGIQSIIDKIGLLKVEEN